MRNGYGSPFVRIYTSVGEVTENIVDFNYKYSQEEDDTCQITIQTSNVDLPDKPEFQENVILKVVWGFIGENKTKTRKVIIRNIKPSYSEGAITFDILCTDKASRIKSNSSKKIHKGTVSNMAKEIADRNGLIYKGVSQTDDGLAIEVTDITGYARPGYYDQNGNYNIAVDNTAVPRRVDFRLYDQLPQANKSDFHLLKDAASGDPAGPLELYGRDDELILQKKNLNQKPIKVYTYGDGTGLLLSFEPESKNLTRKGSSGNINIDAFNPEDKTSYNIDANDFTNNLPKLGDTTEVPARFYNNLGYADESDTSEDQVNTGPNKKDRVVSFKNNGRNIKDTRVNSDKPQQLISWEEFKKNQSNLPKNSEPGFQSKLEKNPADTFDSNYALKTDYGIINFSNYNTAHPGFYNKDGNYTIAVDNTAVVVPFGDSNSADEKTIDYTKNVPSSEHSLEEAYGKGSNQQAEGSLKKNPAEAKIVGDIDIESGKIITILNVSKKFSGNYYVEEAVHEIKPGSAYTVRTKMTKNAMGITSGDSPNKTRVTSFDGIPKVPKKTQVNKQVKPEDLMGKSLTEQLKILNNNTPITKDWKGNKP